MAACHGGSGAVQIREHQIACQSAGKQLPPPKANLILVAFGNVSVLDMIKKVCSSELEVSLLVLPPASLFNRYVQYSLEVELVCRCLFFLLRVHFGQISSNQMLLTVIDELRTNTISKVREFRDVLGFNSTGLQFLQRKVESKEDTTKTTAPKELTIQNQIQSATGEPLLPLQPGLKD
ncbi:unnamed protein product [Coregonus sp. 'balchen']|nr:unnamed protein product [Coregonus sp. 'balchen']